MNLLLKVREQIEEKMVLQTCLLLQQVEVVEAAIWLQAAIAFLKMSFSLWSFQNSLDIIENEWFEVQKIDESMVYECLCSKFWVLSFLVMQTQRHHIFNDRRTLFERFTKFGAQAFLWLCQSFSETWENGKLYYAIRWTAPLCNEALDPEVGPDASPSPRRGYIFCIGSEARHPNLGSENHRILQSILKLHRCSKIWDVM